MKVPVVGLVEEVEGCGRFLGGRDAEEVVVRVSADITTRSPGACYGLLRVH